MTTRRLTCHCGAIELEITGLTTHHQRKVNLRQFGLNVAVLTGLNPRDLGTIP